MKRLLFNTQKYWGTLLYKNGISQYLSEIVFPPIDVKSVIIIDGFPGKGSTDNVVTLAWLVASINTPLHASVPSKLYVSKLHVNGGFTGGAVKNKERLKHACYIKDVLTIICSKF